MEHPGHRLRAVARGMALLAVVISPYLFGSSDPWAHLSVCLIAGIPAAAWLAAVVSAPGPRVRAPTLTLVLLGLPVLLVLQMLPLSRRLVESLSPEAARARSAQIDEFARSGAPDFLPPDLERGPEPITLSASPAATTRSLYLLAAYLGVFLVTANCLTEWRHVRSFAAVLAASGFLMALVGIAQRLSGTRSIYWFHVPRFGGNIFGPFTNRNHYALQMNMLIGASLGLLLAGLPGADRSAARTDPASSLRESLASLSDASRGRTLLLGFAVALMAASVLISLSRGGISSLALAVGLVGVVMAFRSEAGRQSRAFWPVAVVMLGLVVWLGWRPVVERLGTLSAVARDPLGDWRLIAKRDTLRLFASAPVFGCGFGSFQHVFSVFQSPAIQEGRWLHAHDDYLQLLAEGGIVGAALFALAAGLFVAHLWRHLPRASVQGRMMAAGLGVSILAVALHSAVDYGLHKPANAFLLAALCGMLLACAHLPDSAGVRDSADRLATRLGALAALAVVAALMLGELGALRGELAFRRFLRLAVVTPEIRETTAFEDAVRSGTAEADLVMELAGGDSDPLWTVSATCMRWAARDELNPLLRLNVADLSVGAAALAVRAAPSNYENWLQLARAFRGIGLGRQAQGCLERARAFAPPGLEVDM